ncbi:MAG TPA: FlgD immunoglobulin-like domain containing protein, partial [bacterium]
DNGDTGDKRSYGDVGINITDGISPPFTLSYQGYFLGKEHTSKMGAQIALYEQNPLQLEFAPQDFASTPVELVAFNATVDGQDAHLDWITATETNNFGFDIERRSLNREWTKLGFIPGNGTTTRPSRYEFVDRSLQSGTYDYRLKQIDTDGAFEYSEMVTATIGQPTTFALAQNFPNPFNPSTEIQYQLAAAENSSQQRTLLKIYNILGQEVRTLVNEEQPAGFYSFTWDGRGDDGQRLSSGIYVYRLQSGKFVATRKMLLVQ